MSQEDLILRKIAQSGGDEATDSRRWLTSIDVDPDSSQRIVYPGGLVSAPMPPPAAAFGVSRKDAVGIAVAQNWGPSPGEAPVATLRMVTVDSERSPTSRAQPGWVLTWHEAATPIGGGLRSAATTRPTLPALRVVVLDADTGQVIDGIHVYTLPKPAP